MNKEEFLDYVKKYDGSLEELAKDIGAMSYDAISRFLGCLADDLKRQQGIDDSLGRKKLVKAEQELLENLYNAREKMDRIWEICKNYSIVHSREKKD